MRYIVAFNRDRWRDCKLSGKTNSPNVVKTSAFDVITRVSVQSVLPAAISSMFFFAFCSKLQKLKKTRPPLRDSLLCSGGRWE